MKRFKIYLAFSLFLSSPSQATSQEWLILGATTASVAGAAAGIWFGISPPSSCHWCQPSPAEIDVTKALEWENPGTANLVSNIVGYGVVPAVSLATAGYSAMEWKRFGQYSLILANAGLLELFVTEWMKKTIARQRPESFYHKSPTNAESYVSFPSGHTSLTFALATAATAIAYREDRRLWPYLVTTGFALSAFTGYLRIAALKHWMNDVFVGAGIGIMTGLVPTVLLQALPEDL